MSVEAIRDIQEGEPIVIDNKIKDFHDDFIRFENFNIFDKGKSNPSRIYISSKMISHLFFHNNSKDINLRFENKIIGINFPNFQINYKL